MSFSLLTKLYGQVTLLTGETHELSNIKKERVCTFRNNIILELLIIKT